MRSRTWTGYKGNYIRRHRLKRRRKGSHWWRTI